MKTHTLHKKRFRKRINNFFIKLLKRVGEERKIAAAAFMFFCAYYQNIAS